MNPKDNSPADKNGTIRIATLAEQINAGMAAVPVLVASYTRALQATDARANAPKDFESQDRGSCKSS